MEVLFEGIYVTYLHDILHLGLCAYLYLIVYLNVLELLYKCYIYVSPVPKMSGPPLERNCGPGVSNQRELSLAYSSNIQDAAHWGVSHPVLTVRTMDLLQSPFHPPLIT